MPLLANLTANAAPIPVEVRQTDTGWQLYRGGEPYFVKGAGGSGSLEQLAAAGGNSLRTWGAEGLEERLDEAHALELSVTIGIWLGHERHGFDYSDEAQVKAQLDQAREYVLRYKDHPAVLMWGVGNEMEGFEDGGDERIWKAVNDIAAMIKELDPNHPTMTVTAEIGGGRIPSINTIGTAIDIHGINAYGGASSIAERYREAGGVKPYMLTEFGPIGSWEVPASPWGAPPEMTSRQKASFYRNTYEKAILGAPELAVGSYAFTWGHKMEATSTWFGMFLADGSRLPVIDTMTELWSGEPPADRCPDIEPLTLEGPDQLDAGAEVAVTLTAADPEGGPLTAKWALRRESGEYATGGDNRPQIPDIEGAILSGDTAGARIRMPDKPGGYRLFTTVYDEAGNAATANVALLVKGTPPNQENWPYVVFDDDLEAMPWAPSGWMGDTDALSLAVVDDECRDGSCLRIGLAEGASWGGIAWQHPPNNWGDHEGGHDVSDAKALEFWARGTTDGETITIGVGMLGDDTAHPDSARVSQEDLALRSKWKRYRIKLKDADLSSIKTAFFVTLGGRQARTIYFDRIRFIGN
ncbi:MAG: glycoside hydrolase family 2 TIM barrel-domain containing protein [Myxococcota bacterium]